MAPEAKKDTPPEFPTEDHRESHVAALVREKEGYEAKVKGFEVRGDEDQAAYYKTRVGEVEAELKRLADAAKSSRASAATR